MSKGQTSPPPLIGLGQVSGAHGIRGGLKVRADAGAATTDPAVFIALGEVVIGGRVFKVQQAQQYKNQVLLYLAGITTRNQAQELVGHGVQGDGRRFPALPPGEYYWFQVLGLPVYDAGDGSLLGYLEEVIPTPGHDVYAVRQGDREVLLPAVEEVIAEINLEEGYVKVTPLPGLLETYVG